MTEPFGLPLPLLSQAVLELQGPQALDQGRLGGLVEVFSHVAGLKPAVAEADDDPARRLLDATEGRGWGLHAGRRFLVRVKVERNPGGQTSSLLELLRGLLPHRLKQGGEAQFRRFFFTP